MPAGNKANVTTGKRRVSGGIFWGPPGTTLPTDANTALAAAFKSVGYVGEDGLTNAKSRDTMTIKEWGGETVASEVISQDESLKWKSIEYLNVDTLKAVYGSENVTVDASGNITVISKAGTYGQGVWVVDMALNGGRLERIVVPDGNFTDMGDIVYVGTDAVAFDLTLACNFDATVGGTMVKYISAPPASTT